MKIIVGKEQGLEIITVGFEPGEFLLESIHQVIEECDIKNGLVLTGFGTLKSCQMHYVSHDRFPPTDVLYMIEKPMELLSMDGIIADGSPHIHITVSHSDKDVYGGHLEPQSEVLYLAEISFLKFESIKLKRIYDQERAISLLRDAR